MTTQTWLETDRCALRTLKITDATERYLTWMKDAAGTAIISARKDYELSELQDYIRARIDRPDVLFLGIFCIASKTHIGNLKFEPIDRKRGEAALGILIGAPDWRGVGIAQEILPAACDRLGRDYAIDQIALGVDSRNLAAQVAYKRSGFELGKSTLIPSGDGYDVMVRRC